MKHSNNSLCTSTFSRKITMNYILSIIMLLALNTALFATGTRTIKFTYTHKIKFTDPSNNVNDPLGVSNATLTPGPNQVLGGAPCVPGTDNCVGGSNTVGNTWRVFYNSSNVLDSVQDGPVARRVVPGKYYNPDIMSKVDNNFSTLTDITFELKSGATTVWSHNFALAGISTNASAPTTFDQFDQLSGGTWLGTASVYRNAEGSIILTTAPLITNALETASSLVLTATPTVSGAGLADPVSLTLNVASLCAQGPKIGITKFAQTSANHEGWYLMDGTSNNTITNPNARAAAQLLFGGAGGFIPNTDGLYTVATTTAGQANSLAGVVNNQIIVNNSNINQANLSTAVDGAHIHDVNDSNWGLALQDGNNTNNGTDLDFSPGEINIQSAVLRSWRVNNTNSSHSHSFSIGTATPTPISIQPRSAKLYQFVYLGQ